VTLLNAVDLQDREEEKLPRRDWVLLPLLSLLTISILVGSTELIARRTFSESKTGIANCMVNDPSTGPRGIPNTICFEKGAESPTVEYRLNSCGHRAGIECGPKAVGTYRIVMMGSSLALGVQIPLGKTMATLLPGELSRMTGRKVELYNEGMLSEHPHVAALRLNDALAAKPDLILWVLTPYDFEEVSFVSWETPSSQLPPSAGHAGTLVRFLYNLKTAFAATSFEGAANEAWQALGRRIKADPARIMLLHVLYKSQKQTIKSYLIGSDDETGFLKSEMSGVWKSRLKQFDAYDEEMNSRATADGVPFVVVLVPTRAQASLISMGEWPVGYDPYKFNDELDFSITSKGGTYINILPEFRTVPNPERYYFPVDGHPDADGHRIISEMLAQGLTNGAIPALRATSTAPAASQQGR
jgi:hypothetical protein